MSGVWDDSERAALVALLRVRPTDLTWPEITARVAQEGSARAVWAQLVPQDLFHEVEHSDDPLRVAARDVAAWTSAPFAFHTFMDDAYPAQLRDVHQMPPVLFTRGRLLAGDLGVCVVGSRSASPRGRELAGEVATALAGEGLSVVSGLAAGIDRAAHEAALAAGGRTVAVIGTGITH
ncbi:MAG: DNA-processing protein DprA, partial [Actinomycetales bacterium]|nr:DNA-processing protein DprA [Actinomycetales bacterium]